MTALRCVMRQNLTIFFVSFPVKGTCEGAFYYNFLPTAILPKVNFFCKFFLIFDKKCRPIIFRWILLFVTFTQVVFREKVCVLLKLPHLNLITLLRRLDQSNEIHFTASWSALIIKRRSNHLVQMISR